MHRERPSRPVSSSSAIANLLTARAARIGLAPRLRRLRGGRPIAPSDRRIEVWHQPLAAPVTPGEPDPSNAHSVLALLQRASDACATGAFSALVTAPIQKSVLMDAGIPFAGHTEFFAQRTHYAARRDAARRRRAGCAAAGRARHDAPRAEGRAGRGHAGGRRRDARHRRRRAPREVRARLAPDRRLRTQSACRRGRAPGTRGDRRHRPGDRGGARRAATTSPARCRPTRSSCPRSRDASMRSSRCTTIKDCRLEGRELRPRHQRDARAAVHPHVGRPWHRARPRGRRGEGARRGSGSLIAAVDLAIALAKRASVAPVDVSALTAAVFAAQA